ncbi:transcriptional regulator NrdR [Eubacteriales bacterium OttesenSCG-928-G02]|nr:transcriptional regulator NrdR [Eubacteriales bacterium OttesenSCG-928-G02]
MKCPFCAYLDSKVIDSRPASEGGTIRRRRECLSCQKRFTTYETIETVPLTVVKKDKSRESFDRNKLLASIIRPCGKRQISREQMEDIVNQIEAQLQNSLQSEILTAQIGEIVMEKLKEIDQVAYIRYASVHRHFKDVDEFMLELTKLLNEKV